MVRVTKEQYVITDANILIHFMALNALKLLALIPGFTFAIPNNVLEEITYEEERISVQEAIDENVFILTELTDLDELTFYSDFQEFLGKGEAACLAIAVCRGWYIATSDSERRLIREITKQIGMERYINTPGLIKKLIEEKILTIEKADDFIGVLKKNDYSIKFNSFREIIN